MENRIKEIREEKGMTQIELSGKAKISQPYLHDLENNRRGAKPETMHRIAEALEVEDSALIASKKEVS